MRPHNNGVEAPWATKSLKDLAAKGKASAAVKEGGKDGRIAELEAKVSELTTSVDSQGLIEPELSTLSNWLYSCCSVQSIYRICYICKQLNTVADADYNYVTLYNI